MTPLNAAITLSAYKAPYLDSCAESRGCAPLDRFSGQSHRQSTLRSLQEATLARPRPSLAQVFSLSVSLCLSARAPVAHSLAPARTQSSSEVCSEPKCKLRVRVESVQPSVHSNKYDFNIQISTILTLVLISQYECSPTWFLVLAKLVNDYFSVRT